jgi:hypothetical protein
MQISEERQDLEESLETGEARRCRDFLTETGEGQSSSICTEPSNAYPLGNPFTYWPPSCPRILSLLPHCSTTNSGQDAVCQNRTVP